MADTEGQGLLITDENAAAVGAAVADAMKKDQGATDVLPEDPRTERKYSWSVEVLFKSGRSERETVKAVARDKAFTYEVEDGEYHMSTKTLVIDGVTALMRIDNADVAMVRVSRASS